MSPRAGAPVRLRPQVPDTRPVTRGVCMKCGHRLVPTERGGFVHESGLLRCDPPATSICSVCRGDALVQCMHAGCGVMAHPDCLARCSCCAKLDCIAHTAHNAADEPLCHECFDREEGSS